MVCKKGHTMINMPGQELWHVTESLADANDDCRSLRHCRCTYSKQEPMDAYEQEKDDEDETQEQPKHGVAEPTTNVFDLGLDLSPYIKEELKLTIQRKRAEKGLEEIKVDHNEVHRYDLSEDEHQKKQRRRERNKLAAAKLRTKKKSAEYTMREEYEKQSELNKKLKYDLERIEREKAVILECLNESQSKQLTETETLLSLTSLNLEKIEKNAANHSRLDEIYKDSVADCKNNT